MVPEKEGARNPSIIIMDWTYNMIMSFYTWCGSSGFYSQNFIISSPYQDTNNFFMFYLSYIFILCHFTSVEYEWWLSFFYEGFMLIYDSAYYCYLVWYFRCLSLEILAFFFNIWICKWIYTIWILVIYFLQFVLVT